MGLFSEVLCTLIDILTIARTATNDPSEASLFMPKHHNQLNQGLNAAAQVGDSGGTELKDYN